MTRSKLSIQNTTSKPKKKTILENHPSLAIADFSHKIKALTSRPILVIKDDELCYTEYLIKLNEEGDLVIAAAWEIDFKCQAATVKIAMTPVGFGKRKWFCCPKCGEKRGRLYLDSETFLSCRVCCNLIYKSCLESNKKKKKHKASNLENT